MLNNRNINKPPKNNILPGLIIKPKTATSSLRSCSKIKPRKKTAFLFRNQKNWGKKDTTKKQEPQFRLTRNPISSTTGLNDENKLDIIESLNPPPPLFTN